MRTVFHCLHMRNERNVVTKVTKRKLFKFTHSPSERSLTPTSKESSVRTYSAVLLVSDFVADVAATLVPNRWFTVDDFPTPVSPSRMMVVW